MRNYDFEYFPKSTPRPVENGLKVRVPDGRGKSSWWASRWVAALDALGWSNRLQRGRSYARNGQVMDFEMEAGRVQAKVQGSRPRPYKVTLGLKAFDDRDWERACGAMSTEASFTASLLAGQMPEGIEKAFAAVGLSLLPKSGKDIQTECSCPDYANPCKHIAALHYVLASEFDRDPFLIFELRGRNRTQVLAGVRQATPVETPEATVPRPPRKAKTAGPRFKAESFWDVPAGESLTVRFTPPAEPAALIRCLGDPPFWTGRESLADALAPVYRKASDAALRWAGVDPVGTVKEKTAARSRAVRKVEEKPAAPKFTQKQGQYLAYIAQYTRLHRQAPAEADLEKFFNVTPPVVHQMVVTLHRLGLIERVPGQARSIRVIVPDRDLPPLE